HVDAEKLVALHPHVVFVTNYAPQEMIDSITRLGIPVIAISLRHDNDPVQAAKINSTPANEDEAYNQGLREGIALRGEV
ncbi:hypothetical protein KSI87_21385, partial [Dickeya zeae]|nr:hypothetical protein [Dickeya zeae]